MKKAVVIVAGLMVLAIVSGCAPKSDAERLRDDMKKAGNQMQKDAKALF